MRAVEKAGTADPVAVRAAIVGLQERNLGGELVTVRYDQHIDKQALVGRVSADGSLRTVSVSAVIPAQPWSEYLK